jgi:tetratricopeptide (TPR) repeat protein
MIRRTIFLLVLVVAAANASAAAPKTAKDFYMSALSHYNLSEWQQALDDFREAYRLKPDAAFLFNIAQCHKQLHHYREAATFYRAYRREGGTNDVESMIVEMDRAAASQKPGQAFGPEPEKAPETTVPATPPPTTAATPPTTGGTGADLTARAAPAEKPLLKRPWFWAVVGGGAVVVATGVTLAVVYGTPAKNPSLSFEPVAGN